MKNKMPIYLSFNLDDDLLKTNNEYFFRIEKTIFEKISKLINE